MTYLDESYTINEKKRRKIRTLDLVKMKQNGRKITSVTCYDASFARILEKTEIDFVLIGDSLANVIQGKEHTLEVKLEEIVYHTKCVRSVLKTPLLIADMPFATAGINREETVRNAASLLRAGAEAVKIEGSTEELCEEIKFLTDYGIPVMGHIGLTPQSVHSLGGFRIQGIQESHKNRLLKEALSLQKAGCFAIVLELVQSDTSEEISKQLEIPTIGIGSGNKCDGNILVLQDLLGMNSQFNPKFLKKFANLEGIIKDAIYDYCSDVLKMTSEPQ